MLLLTEDATLVCKHQNGAIQNEPSQDLLTVAGRRVLVDSDPEGRKIKGCPNVGAGIKPCQKTLAVKTGYSDWVTVGGRRVCLESVTGLTDGTPPGLVKYEVRKPGQDFVAEAS